MGIATPAPTTVPPTALPPTTAPTVAPTVVSPIPPPTDATTPITAKVLAEWHVSMPETMAFGFDSVWVPSHRDPNVMTRIDPVTNQTIATIDGIGYQAHQAIVAGDSVWVTGYGLKKIDPKSNAITSSIQDTEHYSYVAYGFGSLWATNESDRLDRIDPGTSKIIASIELGDGYVDYINVVFATDSAIWVDHIDEAELIRIDPATNSIVSKTPDEELVNEAKSTTSIPKGNGSDFIWKAVTHGGLRGLLRIDPNTGAGITFLAMSPEQIVGTWFLAVTDKSIWVGGHGQFERVDVATNQIEATYKTQIRGDGFIAIGFGSVWLAYEGANLFQRLDIAP